VKVKFLRRMKVTLAEQHVQDAVRSLVQFFFALNLSPNAYQLAHMDLLIHKLRVCHLVMFHMQSTYLLLKLTVRPSLQVFSL